MRRTVLLVCGMVSLLAVATVTLAVPAGQPVATATPGSLTPAMTTTPEPPEPTLTNAEVDKLVQGWVVELEAAAGFSHPVFAHVAYMLLPPYNWLLIRDSYTIRPQLSRINHEEYEYLTVFVNPILASQGGHLVVFRLNTDGSPILLLHQSGGVSFDGVDSSVDLTFDDINGNGLPDLAVDLIWYSTCPTTTLRIFEIHSDGELVDIAPRFYYHRAYRVDLNSDGIVEIKIIVRDGEIPLLNKVNCHDVGRTFFYGWDGTEYSDITATLDLSAFPDVEQYFSTVPGSECIFPHLGMYQVLYDYLSLGRFKEGWERLEAHHEWGWGGCSAIELIKSGTDMGEMLYWVGALLEEQGYE